MKKFTVLSLFILISLSSFSQAFITPVSTLPPVKIFKLELIDGTQIDGQKASVATINGLIKSLSYKDAEGVKHKYKAEQIKTLKVKTGTFAKIDMMVESSSIVDLIDKDFNEILDREYIHYEQALLPKNKDKYRLLQLLNPGFDNRIKVYQDPNAKETNGLSLGDVQVSGGDDKSFLIVKDGAKSEVLKKKKYKKEFPNIFGDCDLAKVMDSSKMKFKNFAAHVFIYDQICGEKE